MKILQKLFLPGLLLLIIVSCTKEEIMEKNGKGLMFSTDTVHFDTIFSSIGSITRQFKVFNPLKQDINISTIYLAGGKSSDFRLNINGIQSHQVNNIALREKDSMYIFVEVTIDPDRNEMLEKDSIVFITNNKIQDIKLIAYGQDVYLIDHYELRNDSLMPADKPFLIRHSFTVDTGIVMQLDSGAKFYFNRNAQLNIEGTLHSSGAPGNPVIFTGSRLDEDYENIPGQWGGVYFTNSSKDNQLQYTEIRNGVLGLRIGDYEHPDNDTANPKIHLHNCMIKNMTYAGISACNAKITSANLVVANCGTYAVHLWNGGAYTFYHTTIANYYQFSLRNEPSVLITNKVPFGNQHISDDMKVLFYNSIVHGYNQSEIEIGETDESRALYYVFDHCLLKANEDKLDLDNTAHFIDPIINENPDFVSVEDQDFQLDSISIAIDKGDYQSAQQYPADYLKNNRLLDGEPDLGAYESSK